jgi:hypothetical protein
MPDHGNDDCGDWVVGDDDGNDSAPDHGGGYTMMVGV